MINQTENELTTICEFGNCKRKCTQADTYMNMWFCDNHYSKVGRMTEDYQCESVETINEVERQLDKGLFIL